MGHPKLISFSAAAAITLAEIALLAAPAHAHPRAPIVVTAQQPIVVRHVSYADLDLSSASGDTTLMHRVAYAVSGLCDDATGGPDGSMTANLLLGRCVRTAWSEARPQIVRAEARARLTAVGFSDVTSAALAMAYPQ